jgi:hypothetical protein
MSEHVKDQADTLRKLMISREKNRRPATDPAVSVYLAPEVRKARLFSPRELALLARERAAEFRIRDESDLLNAGGGDPRILGRLAVVSGDETDIIACYQRVKGLVQDRSVKKMDILVCVPKDGAEGDSQGRRIFTQLFEVCRRFLDIDLAYIGAVSRGEKIRDNLAIAKYLIHCQSGSRDSQN